MDLFKEEEKMSYSFDCISQLIFILTAIKKADIILYWRKSFTVDGEGRRTI